MRVSAVPWCPLDILQGAPKSTCSMLVGFRVCGECRPGMIFQALAWWVETDILMQKAWAPILAPGWLYPAMSESIRTSKLSWKWTCDLEVKRFHNSLLILWDVQFPLISCFRCNLLHRYYDLISTCHVMSLQTTAPMHSINALESRFRRDQL